MILSYRAFATLACFAMIVGSFLLWIAGTPASSIRKPLALGLAVVATPAILCEPRRRAA